MVTSRQFADSCDISLRFARYLLDAGLVPGAAFSGNRRKAPYDAVAKISARPAADLSVFSAPTIGILRVAPAEDADEKVPVAYVRKQVGFHAALPSAVLLAALNRWWRCDPEQVEAGTFLPVTVAGFGVAVLTGLTGAVPLGAGTDKRWCFPNARLLGRVLNLSDAVVDVAPNLTTGEVAAVDAVLARRLDSDSGGPIAYVATRP